MRRSILILALLAMVAGIYACASKKNPPPSIAANQPPKPPPPLPNVHTATLKVATGAKIVARTVLPEGFAPISAFAPIWLQNGSQIALVGTKSDRTFVVVFDSATLKNPRIVATDFGPATPGGSIVDVAASPDGLTLAIAVAAPVDNQLDLVLHDAIAPGEGSRIASFPGQFDAVSISWLDSHTVAVALRARAMPAAQAGTLPAGAPAEKPAPERGGGLFIVDTTGLGAVKQLPIKCPLSHLTWSPNSRFAISNGDPQTPPVLIDRSKNFCAVLHSKEPIRVLGWSPGSDSFLYATPVARTIGTFRYELATGTSALIAVASSAAAFTSTGEALALGNQDLSWQRVAKAPEAPVLSELATFRPQLAEVRIVPLGIRTIPALLAESQLVYTTVTDSAAIDILAPGRPAPLRELIAYLLPPRTAFLLASGPARGNVLMSWSPDGKEVAVLDGDAKTAVLTIFSPAAELLSPPPPPEAAQPPGTPAARKRPPRPAPTHDTP
ncbi:MAG TPA: hypothetical protein VMV15_10860 [Candidatus Binataceae bacterium]|nr:hypothetical protein [Candidatus Binataceae bacterium]